MALGVKILINHTFINTYKYDRQIGRQIDGQTDKTDKIRIGQTDKRTDKGRGTMKENQ